MKTKFILASVIALSGLAGLATTASAGTSINVSIGAPIPRPPVVVVTEPAHDGRAYGGYGDRRWAPPPPRGYWKEIEVKDWVPAHWVVTPDFRGRESRVYEPGHYVCRVERVWVEYGHDHDRFARR
jgi:hypothetical protein